MFALTGPTWAVHWRFAALHFKAQYRQNHTTKQKIQIWLVIASGATRIFLASWGKIIPALLEEEAAPLALGKAMDMALTGSG